MKEADSRAALRACAAVVELDLGVPEVIRLGENHLYRLPGRVVARVGRSGQGATAMKEVAVSRWLEDRGVAAVRAVRGIMQPVQALGHPVTFWHELPPHEPGGVSDIAVALYRLHRLDPPTELELPELAPFVRLAERIEAATTLTDNDRAWLRHRLAGLKEAYADLPSGLPTAVVHGDAWKGNIARTADGDVILLDLERCTLGPPEWDLVSTAVSHVTTGWLSREDWAAYSEAYGFDVTTWDGFSVLRDIRELRMTLMACQLAAVDPSSYRQQAIHRLACIRCNRGPRPWNGWTTVP